MDDPQFTLQLDLWIPTLWKHLYKENPVGTPVNILELGTFEGFTSTVLINDGWLNHPDSRLTCVDSFIADKNAKERWKHNMSLTGKADQITLKDITTEEFFETNTETFDLIFVDAMHTYEHVLHDGKESAKILRKGGLLVFDDCAKDQFPGVVQAVDELDAMWGNDMILLLKIYQRMYRKM